MKRKNDEVAPAAIASSPPAVRFYEQPKYNAHGCFYAATPRALIE